MRGVLVSLGNSRRRNIISRAHKAGSAAGNGMTLRESANGAEIKIRSKEAFSNPLPARSIPSRPPLALQVPDWRQSIAVNRSRVRQHAWVAYYDRVPRPPPMAAFGRL